jgi:hypothetical protein
VAEGGGDEDPGPRRLQRVERLLVRLVRVTASTSASVITVTSAPALEVPPSPEMFSLRRSTPSRASVRATRRTSSGPFATQQKVGLAS